MSIIRMVDHVMRKYPECAHLVPAAEPDLATQIYWERRKNPKPDVWGRMLEVERIIRGDK